MAASIRSRNNGQAAWFSLPKPRPLARLRLFCLPFAGGSAAIFRAWPASLPEDVEIVPVLLPGRGSRASEQPAISMRALIEELASRLLFYADKPFAFFGHSLGATICFELAQYLSRNYGLDASHLFASACLPPHLRNAAVDAQYLSDEDYINAMRRMNDIPPELARNTELMRIAAETLRADHELYRSYHYQDAPPLAFPITVYGGCDDPLAQAEALAGWQAYTTAAFRMKLFAGGHFFISTAENILLPTLSAHLGQVLLEMD